MEPRAERCGLCRYWPRYPYAEVNDMESGIAGGEASECRRYAPRTGAKTAHPWVIKDHWCGEFEARTAPTRTPQVDRDQSREDH